MFESSDDQALIMLTGFDHATFHDLHTLFAPGFNALTPVSRGENGFYLGLNITKMSGGCPKSVDGIAGLVIVLSWTCTQGAAWVQSMLFGVTGSTFSDRLRFGECCLNIVLYDNVHAQIEMGSEEKIRL